VKGVVFAPQYDSPGKKDATGAFLPESKRFADMHKFTRVTFDNHRPMAQRLVDIESSLALFSDLDCIAFFCHGWADGIQAGMTRKSLLGFCEKLVPHIRKVDFKVALYACSTAEDGLVSTNDKAAGPGGDQGFADKCGDTLKDMGVNVSVLGHVTAGHTTRNPFVRIFRGGVGGNWLVSPDDVLWSKWVKALHGDLRFRFPFMTAEQIRQELSK